MGGDRSLTISRRWTALDLPLTPCCPSADGRGRQQCSGSSRSRPVPELTVSAAFQSSRRQGIRGTDDRSQSTADIARSSERCNKAPGAAGQLLLTPSTAEGRSKVRWPMGRTGAADPLQTFIAANSPANSGPSRDRKVMAKGFGNISVIHCASRHPRRMKRCCNLRCGVRHRGRL